MSVDAVGEQLRELADVVFEPDVPPDFYEVVTAHAAELRVVAEQICELSTLLHEVEARQAGDLLVEAANAQHLAQEATRVVEAQGLVEVADQQKRLHRRSVRRAPNV